MMEMNMNHEEEEFLVGLVIGEDEADFAASRAANLAIQEGKAALELGLGAGQTAEELLVAPNPALPNCSVPSAPRFDQMFTIDLDSAPLEGSMSTCARVCVGVEDGQLYVAKRLMATPSAEKEILAMSVCSHHQHVLPVVAVFREALPLGHALLPGTAPSPTAMSATVDVLIVVTRKLLGDSLALFNYFNNNIIPSNVIARMAKQLLEALCHMHSCGFVHGDVKPENVLYDEQGNFYLMDFGFSLPHGHRHVGAFGTPAFLSPEALLGMHAEQPSAPLEPSLDVYMFGVTLFLMATSAFPFGPTSNSATTCTNHTGFVPDFVYTSILHRHFSSDALARLEHRAQIDSEASSHLKSLISLAMDPNPASRPTAAYLLTHPFFAAL